MARTEDGSHAPVGMDLGGLFKHLGLSREEVARRLGVSKNSVDNWCCGRTRVTLRHLSRLVLLLKDAGGPRDLLCSLLDRELARHGVTEDAVGLLGDTPGWLTGRPIVLVGSHMESGAHQFIGRGLSDGLRAMGASQLVCLDTYGRIDALRYYFSDTLHSAARGIVVAAPRLPEYELHEMADRLATRRIPCVFVHVSLATLPRGSGSVQVDDYRAAAIATETLWLRGHRNIVAIATERLVDQEERAQGFHDTMKRLGGSARVIWTLAQGDEPRPTAVADRPDSREAAEFIAADRSISAILTLSSFSIKEIMRTLHNKSHMPGRDVSVMALGCWDWMHEIAFPQITHVALPYYEAGQQAARLVLALGTSPSPREARVVVPVGVDALHGANGGTIAGLP